MNAHRGSPLGRYLRRSDPFPGRHLSLGVLAAQGIDVRGRLEGFSGATPRLADGAAHSIDVVVWATGYTDDTDWLRVPGATDAQGRVIEADGVAPVRGLYYVGRSWQRSRGSALLLGVGADARHVVHHITNNLQATSARPVVHHQRDPDAWAAPPHAGYRGSTRH